MKEFKSLLIKGGVPLLVIVVGWEIVEDVVFPAIFWWLGKNVNPVFYSAMPVSWLLCLHWLAVPVLWGLWIRLFKK